jgi:hypothetical protein
MSTADLTQAPFTFIATYAVAPGHEGALTQLAAGYASELQAAEPDTHALGLYFDAEQKTFTHVQMLADSTAMEEHLVRIQDYLTQAADHVRIRSIEVFGDVGPKLRTALDHNVDDGARLREHAGAAFGFGRSSVTGAGLA